MADPRHPTPRPCASPSKQTTRGAGAGCQIDVGVGGKGVSYIIALKARDSFVDDVCVRHRKNIKRYGFQDRETIFEGLVEEVEEIARALLNRYESNQVKDGPQNLKKECVDAAAVLLEIYIQSGVYAHPNPRREDGGARRR